MGDTVDLLFNVDINEYRGTVSAQMLIRDSRLSEEYTKKLACQKERYAQIRGGDAFSVSENVIPDRDDCARVYNFLRKEYRGGNSLGDTKSILKEINTAGLPEINYIKLKYVFEIFNELKICEISELDRDIYSFQVVFQANKTSIDKSAILKKLKSQCTDRNQQDAK